MYDGFFARTNGSLVCLSLVIFTLVGLSEGWAQGVTPAQKPPAVAPPAAAPAAVAPPAAAPEVDSIAVFLATAPSVLAGGTTSQSGFILEIIGKNFGPIDLSTVRVIPFPATGVTAMAVLSISSDGTKIFAQFTAPSTYVLQQVALSLSSSNFITFNTNALSCDFAKSVSVASQIVPESQSKTKYGNGIGSNFYVVQLSIVNKCPMPIDIPLAGIKIRVSATAATTISDVKKVKHGKNCETVDPTDLIPFSLDHLTSIYSEDRQLTGARAIYFNSLQAAATIGSAIEPFLAAGFTQAVAILGGGFTTASKQIFIDMSAQQLQDLTSQSFGSVEQVASGGPLQKFVFVNRKHGCSNSPLENNLREGNFKVRYDLIPASAQAPATQESPATPAAAGTP